jgi:Icc-related predicted phosphoesterase
LSQLLVATDLHQRSVLYRSLVRYVIAHRPAALILGGDFLHGTGMSPYGNTRQLSPAQCAQELAALTVPIAFVRGNHEDQNWFEFCDAWAKIRPEPPQKLHGQYLHLAGFDVVGFPCSMGDEFSFCDGNPLGCSDPSDWLDEILIAEGIRARQIWIMHEPPTGTALTTAGSAVEGNTAWRAVIKRERPSLVICGHDHLTPLKRGQWQDESGQTKIVNVGQNMDGPLHASLVSLLPGGAPVVDRLVLPN